MSIIEELGAWLKSENETEKKLIFNNNKIIISKEKEDSSVLVKVFKYEKK